MPLNDQTSSKMSGKIISHIRQASVDSGTSPKFPRIEDCAHFHYEAVDYGCIKVAFVEESADGLKLNGSLSLEGFNPAFNIRITCKGNTWTVRRSLSHFETLDVCLHECVFDRKFSHLPTLITEELRTKTLDDIQVHLRNYLKILSGITDVDGSAEQISCAPVLHWLEIDNHGRNLVPHALGDVADINIPAIAAARVVRRYQACDEDELTLNVGDMVSIIEMGKSGWWRGKQGLRVGSFPSQCVKRINSATDVVGTHDRPFSPPKYTTTTTATTTTQMKPIVRKHGKFMEFLRSFLDTRPSKSVLKKKGIFRERVFGCDLGELLHRTDEDVPTIVTDCTRYIEKYGIIDGIYRVSGVASHIRHLKYEFDSDRRPDLENAILDMPKLGNVPGMAREGNYKCDAHSVAGLCKLYFRELPNPLLTYQLYNRFACAVTDYEAEERLLKVHDVIQQLPPPHYRALKHLIDHLRFMSQQDGKTSMHSRNLAIVWAPNLLRSREIEAGLAAFTEARVQSVVTEFLIVNGDLLFSEKLQTMQYDSEHKPPRPRSLMILPTPKLISLEEAQARSKSGVVTPVSQQATSFDTNISGVRLRNTSSKSSSNEKRKRHKKTSSNITACPTHLTYSSKKQGHPCTASFTEVLSTPAKVQDLPSPSSLGTSYSGSGWKVKLGSFLRKNNHPVRSSAKQASLRRIKSCDSLVATQETEKCKIDALEFSNVKRQLTRTQSYEDTNLSDRSYPEPQVPHIRPIPPTPHKLCKLEPLKDYNDAPKSNKYLRSASPFSAILADLPSVMGDDGLDFDPMTYRVNNCNKISLEKDLDRRSASQESELNASSENRNELKFNDAVKSQNQPAIKPTDKNPTKLDRSFKSVTSANNGAVSSSRMTFNATISSHTPPTFHNAYISLLKTPTPLFVNTSSNNNVTSRDSISSLCNLDTITAECLKVSQDQQKARTNKMSATERLSSARKSHSRGSTGLPISSKGQNSKRIAPDPVKPTCTKLGIKENESIDSDSEIFGSHQSTSSANRQLSVQIFNPLKKNDHHYGSFIALVGSNAHDKRTTDKINPDVFDNSLNDRNLRQKSLEGKKPPSTPRRPKEFSKNLRIKNQDCYSNLKYPIYNPPEYYCKPLTTSTSYYKGDEPFLGTFCPDGKRRENYPNTPPTYRSSWRNQHDPSIHYQQPANCLHPNLERIPNIDGPASVSYKQQSVVRNSCRDSRNSNSSISTKLYPYKNNYHNYSKKYFISTPSRPTAFDNMTYLHCFPPQSSHSQVDPLPVRCSTSGWRKYQELNLLHPNPAYPLSVPVSARPTAYHNPSFAQRPIYYRKQTQYNLLPNRNPPSPQTPISQSSAALSWV